jgi:hypothetical protein
VISAFDPDTPTFIRGGPRRRRGVDVPMIVSAIPFDPIYRLRSRLFVSDIIWILGSRLNPIMRACDKLALG